MLLKLGCAPQARRCPASRSGTTWDWTPHCTVRRSLPGNTPYGLAGFVLEGASSGGDDSVEAGASSTACTSIVDRPAVSQRAAQDHTDQIHRLYIAL